MRYLFLDTECGGLDEDTSLLTLGMILTNDKFNILDLIEFKIKPDDDNYIVTGQGLSVNKIDLASHDKEAKTYKQTGTDLYNFLSKWYYTLGNREKFIPVGKNIYFDTLRIWKYLVNRATWEQFVSYQPLEINGAVRLLQLQGKIPPLEKSSLSALADHFNISVPPTWLHNCIGDCRIYIEVLSRLVQL